MMSVVCPVNVFLCSWQGSQEDGELITWYRKTCLGMGAGLAMSLVRQGYYKKEPEVFIPPRWATGSTAGWLSLCYSVMYVFHVS